MKINTLPLVADIEKLCDTYLVKKAPALPKDIKDLIVKVLPYLVGLGLIMSVVGLLTTLRIFSFGTTYYGMMAPVLGVYYYLSIVSLIINTIIMALAFSGVRAQKKQGWDYLFLGALINMVFSLLSINIINILLSIVLGFYPLFQIKEHYTK